MIAAILNSAILDSAILHKKNFTHSFWLNLMMAAILNSAILDSAILHKKTSLIHSDSTWWWQPSWILPCWIQTLPSWIQTLPFRHLVIFSQIHSKTLSLHSDSDSNLFNLTQTHSFSLNLMMAVILNSGHLGFSHLSSFSQTHAHLPRLVPTIFTKNFTHSFWLNLMMAAILNSAILDSAICTKKLHSCILTQIDDGSHLEFCYLGFSHFEKVHLFILTQLDDGSHLEICHCWFSHLHKKNFTHAFSLNLMMATILNSAMLDSDTAILDSNTLLSSLRFTQTHSPSTLTLSQTNSIWLT